MFCPSFRKKTRPTRFHVSHFISFPSRFLRRPGWGFRFCATAEEPDGRRPLGRFVPGRGGERHHPRNRKGTREKPFFFLGFNWISPYCIRFSQRRFYRVKVGFSRCLGSWFLVLGSWFLALGSWFLFVDFETVPTGGSSVFLIDRVVPSMLFCLFFYQSLTTDRVGGSRLGA